MPTSPPTPLYSLTDPEACAVNRQGMLTAGQRQKLRGFRAGNSILISLVVGGLGLFSCLFLQRIDPVLQLIPILLCFGLLGWIIASYYQEGEALEAPTLNQGLGELIWQKNHYAFKLDDGQVLKLPDLITPPKPGEYALWYLPDFKVVVSAEALNADGPQELRKEREFTQTVFGSVLDFTAEELAANIAGEVSERQLNKLYAPILSNALGGGALITLGLLIFAVSVFNGKDLASTLGIALIALIVTFSGGAFCLSAYRVWKDYVAPRAVSLSGPIKKHIVHGKNSTTYYYKLEGRSFVVTQSAYEAIREGERYCVYYLINSNRLLSLIPLD